MDHAVSAVLARYHDSMQRREPLVPGGRHEPLLAVGPETGQLLYLLVRSLDKPLVLELGTSFGYSGIWLADAARAAGGRVISMELHPHKAEIASRMATEAGLASFIEFRTGDAVQLIDELRDRIHFVLVDLWKDLYVPCLEAFYPKLADGALIVADNMIYPGGADVHQYAAAIRAKPGMSSVLLPVGSGLELSRYEAG
ncbi:O-methyltransferase [uncultured Sphingomonas sp.]|uniref:O-methyltransferase n=1 Tax=uncultured Sphingomonas sp. TaxID=158754 RepID=UPI0035CB2B2E